MSPLQSFLKHLVPILNMDWVRALLVVAGSFATWILARIFVERILYRFIRRTRTTLDDVLVEHNVIKKSLLLVPFALMGFLSPYAISFSLLLKRIADAGLALAMAPALNAFLDALNHLYEKKPISRRWPIRGYVQFIKIVIWIGAAIASVCALTGRSPWSILSGLGAMSAVLMLVFRQTLLSFVATFQVLSQNLLQVGDWIEMPQYGVDGEVVEITFSNLIVRNWDNTLVVVPAYKLLDDSFKNWRGMEISGGRRIKRAIYIDQNSIKFCTDQMIEKFKRIHLLKDYIEQKLKEIEEDARARNVDLEASILNGRRLTNIGVFRIYVENYLKAHPLIRKDMTLMVRQLDPTPQGLPLEIYCFAADTRWVPYEKIQADIFDHILASVPEFELSIFQFPTDRAIRKIL